MTYVLLLVMKIVELCIRAKNIDLLGVYLSSYVAWSKSRYVHEYFFNSF